MPRVRAAQARARNRPPGSLSHLERRSIVAKCAAAAALEPLHAPLLGPSRRLNVVQLRDANGGSVTARRVAARAGPM